MPKIKYCKVQNCAHFTGTTNKEIRMFKFPTENEHSEQKTMWINAISKANANKCDGIGLVCSAHFLSTDIRKKPNGEIGLEANVVPTQFKTQSIPVCFKSQSSSSAANVQSLSLQPHCDNCIILKIKLDQLKKSLFKAKVDSDFELQKKNDQVQKLQCKNNNGLLTVKGLKERIIQLEKLVEENNSEIQKLQGQMNQLPEVNDIKNREIINCLVNGQRRMTKYPKEVREFALNLHFCSPRAYEHVRKTFDGHLPHNATIRKWYALSDLNAKPGITDKTLEFLRKKVAEMKSAGKELVCSVCFDEMSIRKQISWCQSEGHMLGYITYGNDGDEEPSVAKEAIVFIVNGVNERFSIPIAYHFVNSLDATQKLQLVVSVLRALLETGVKITSITFDGHPTNKAMCKMLGANFDVYSDQFQPYFTLDGIKIFIFLDVCHMEKLIRGHLDRKSKFKDQNHNVVEWKYIEQLVNFAYEKGFTATHKLNKSHIEWRRRPMHVRTAVETFSKSTADSIQYLMTKGWTEFAGADATIYFIRLFNDLFDVLNTKFVHNHENIFKNSMDATNKNEIYALFERAIEYIKNLTFTTEDGIMRKLCRSDANTGFIGFIINMRSLQLLFEKYVENEKLIPCIPTYFLNQDAVEMFFGKIRSFGGCDDNPDVVRFKAAYRKLLGIDSILQSKKGNCEAFQINSNPFSDILYVSSRRDKHTRQSELEDEMVVLEEFETLQEKLTDLNASAHSDLTDDLQNLTIAYIANAIEDKIKSTDTCTHCIQVFNSCKKVESSFFGSNFVQRPCWSTYKICKEADQFLKLQLLKGNINMKTIYYSILNNIDIEEMFNDSDFGSHATHKLYLIRTVVDGYIQIKGSFMARTATQDLHAQKFRFKLRKLIHFHGQ